jgi:nucleoside-diphosphate-sugar epimerase
VKSAIVTGAGGFLGRSLVRELTKNKIKVLAVSRKHMYVNDDAKNIILDLSELEKLTDMTDSSWNTFYHLAWEGTSGKDRSNVKMQLKNVYYTVQAVKVAKALGCSKFVCAGSLMEKEILAAFLKKGLRPAVGHIYSSAKLSAHQMSECVAAELGISHIWGIITNAYGEGENTPRLINTTLRKIIAGEELQFTSGAQNYDFIHVQDVAKAFMLLGKKGKPFREYVIGSGSPRPLKEFLLEIKSILCPDKEFNFGDIPFDGVSLPLDTFDITPLIEDTGFKPEITFAEGITRAAKWLMDNNK